MRNYKNILTRSAVSYGWLESKISLICIQTCMKTIMIDDETYKKLKNMKGEKSFSKFLSILAENAKHGSKDSIKRFYGTLTEKEAEIWEKAIMDSRNNMRERL